jgi:DNA-binding transcriptional ArsR family regulator
MSPRLTPGQRAELTAEATRLYENGATVREAAAAIGRPYVTVHGWLTRAGVQLRNTRKLPRGPKPTYEETQTLRADLRGRYEAGATIQEIAAATGRPPSAIAKHLRAAGTPMRSTGARPGHQPQTRHTTQQRRAIGLELRPLYEAGATVKELARQRGRSYGYIHDLLRLVDTDLRGRGRPSLDSRRDS